MSSTPVANCHYRFRSDHVRWDRSTSPPDRNIRLHGAALTNQDLIVRTATARGMCLSACTGRPKTGHETNLRAEGVEQRAERLALERHPVAPHLPVQPERLIGVGARRAGCTMLRDAHFCCDAAELTCWEPQFAARSALYHNDHSLVADNVIKVPMYCLLRPASLILQAYMRDTQQCLGWSQSRCSDQGVYGTQVSLIRQCGPVTRHL